MIRSIKPTIQHQYPVLLFSILDVHNASDGQAIVAMKGHHHDSRPAWKDLLTQGHHQGEAIPQVGRASGSTIAVA